MEEKILLLDGHSIANRAFYGVPLLTNSRGAYTNAVYGFFNILWKVMEQEKPDRVGVAFDVHEPTFRHQIYEAYKGTRSPMPEELRVQIPVLQQMLQDAGVPLFRQPGYEADDILGTLARRYAEKGDSVCILSGDRDLLQLVNERVTLLIPKTKKGGTETEVYHEAEVKEKYGVTPQGYLQMKALMGDPSDNIPGVPAIGEKTAARLIQTYGTLEEVLARRDEVTPARISKNLTEYEAQARLSLTLASIETQCGYEGEAAPVSDLRFASEAFIRCLKELELKTLLQRVLPAAKAAQKPAGEGQLSLDEMELPPEKPAHRIIRDGAALRQCLMELTGAVAMEAFPGVGVAVGDGDHNYWIQPGSGMEWPAVGEAMRALLTDAGRAKLCFDSKRLYKTWSAQGIDVEGVAFDGLLAAYLLNPTKGHYTPDELSAAYLGETTITEEELFGSGVHRRSLAQLTEAERADYAAGITRIIARVRRPMEEELEKQGMQPLYRDIELPLARVLASMEEWGVRIDTKVLGSFGAVLTKEIDALAQEIYELAGTTFNIQSPKQLGEVLFEHLQLPAGKKTKTGYSTSAEILEKLQPEHPIIGKILLYRQVTKLQSTYVDGMGAFIHPEDGKIHTCFQQAVTATGRLSSTDPNLQNIPIRMELGRQLRKAFVPSSDEYIFMDADYSQIELRLLAHMSQDEKMIEAYREKQDIHRMTAAQVLHIPPEEVTAAQRSSAKAVNFGIIYGISAFALGNDLGISSKQAAEYIKNYFAQYPSVESFLQGCVDKARKEGYGVTMFGRRRPIEELKDSNFVRRSFGERVAKNMPIQGSAADIIKIAMVRVQERLKREKMRSRLLLQVHDELLLEVYRPETEQVRRLLEEEMTGAAKLAVPLEVDIHTGENWYEAK